MKPREGVTPLENNHPYCDQNLINEDPIFRNPNIMSNIKYDSVNKQQEISTLMMGEAI